VGALTEDAFPADHADEPVDRGVVDAQRDGASQRGVAVEEARNPRDEPRAVSSVQT
jgi:hypothetical protein